MDSITETIGSLISRERGGSIRKRHVSEMDGTGMSPSRRSSRSSGILMSRQICEYLSNETTYLIFLILACQSLVMMERIFGRPHGHMIYAFHVYGQTYIVAWHLICLIRSMYRLTITTSPLHNGLNISQNSD